MKLDYFLSHLLRMMNFVTFIVTITVVFISKGQTAIITLKVVKIHNFFLRNSNNNGNYNRNHNDNDNDTT